VESVRNRLDAILRSLRTGAGTRSAREIARWRLIIPQMADWLPPEAGDAVRAEFEALFKTGELGGLAVPTVSDLSDLDLTRSVGQR